MTGITIGYDRDNNPELLADTRTTYDSQQKRMALLKANAVSAPDGIVKIELWNSETGISMRWQQVTPLKPKTEKGKTK